MSLFSYKFQQMQTYWKMKHVRNKMCAGFLGQPFREDNILSGQREPDTESMRHENNEHAFDCILSSPFFESICSFFSFFPPRGCLPKLCTSQEKIIEHLTCCDRDLGFIYPEVIRVSFCLYLHETWKKKIYWFPKWHENVANHPSTPPKCICYIHSWKVPYKDILSWLLLINTILLLLLLSRFSRVRLCATP